MKTRPFARAVAASLVLLFALFALASASFGRGRERAPHAGATRLPAATAHAPVNSFSITPAVLPSSHHGTEQLPPAAETRRFAMPPMIQTVQAVPYGGYSPVRRAPIRRKGSGR